MTKVFDEPGETLSRFEVPSRPGNERLALMRVAEVARGCGLGEDRVEKLKTAVAEATMNGIEHGNANREDLPVEVVVVRTDEALIVRVTDQGANRGGSDHAEVPDLALKLDGRQAPRGWGLFLIGKMVDEVDSVYDGPRHTVRLAVRWDGRGQERSDG